MSNKTNSRRSFLKKAGLAAGTVAAAASVSNAAQTKHDFGLNQEEEAFLSMYQKWVNEYIEVIATQKNMPKNMDNNKRIMELSDQAEAWRPQLQEHFKNESFISKYLVISQHMTNSIQ